MWDIAKESTMRHRIAEWAGPATAEGAALLVLLALAVVPAGATTNRFYNPEFDHNVVGWNDPPATLTGGTWDSEDRNACTQSGSAFTSSVTLLIGPLVYFGQCIPVFGGEQISLNIDTRVIAASQPIQGRVVVQFTTGGCGDPPVATQTTTFGVIPFGTWTRMSAVTLVPPEAVTAVVTYQLTSTASFDVLWDRAWASSWTFEIYADDTELGQLCRWSAVVSGG
jgi:hypothetical protein